MRVLVATDGLAVSLAAIGCAASYLPSVYSVFTVQLSVYSLPTAVRVGSCHLAGSSYHFKLESASPWLIFVHLILFY
jgi:hypothetical protein